MNLRQRLSSLACENFNIDNKIFFRMINSDDDLAVSVCELSLTEEQQCFVNPAGFSIGRAYLFPNDNIPYLIYEKDGEREIPVGFISLRFCYHTEDKRSWNYYMTTPPRTTWSYFIDSSCQGRGLGTLSAKLAMRLLLKAAPEYPIELTTEQDNIKAQKLYEKLGFERTSELDGDDIVYLYTPKSAL